MKDFFKAFLSFGLATSIQKLLGFIILPIYTRYFNKVEYGIIDMVTTVLSIAAIFGLLQLETALQRYYYEYKGLKRKLLVSNIYMMIAGLSIMIGILLFLLAPVISNSLFGSVEYAILLRIASVQLTLNNINMLGLVLLRFEKENFKFLKVILVNVFFSLLLVYLFIIRFEIGLSGVFYAQLGAIFISSSLATYYIRNFVVLKHSKLIAKKSLNFALPQFPARVGSIVLGQANRFFMLAYLSLGAIGIYSVSMKLASSIQLINTAFILAWGPFMNAQFKNKNNKQVFANVFPLVVGGTFLFVCLITLYSQEMVQLLATEEFYSSYKYVGGLALFFSLYIIKEVVDIGPKIREKTKFISFNFFLSVIVNVVCLFIFIQLFALEGVVLSMIITNLFLVIISWIVSNKLYYIPFSIFYFIILIIPVFVLSISMMIFHFSLLVRSSIAIACLIFYSVLLFKFYKRIKEINL